jgi:hypothetical protein
MQANGGSVKLSLEDDEYSRVLHYMTDNGGYYCFCNVFLNCLPDRTTVPMHVTISELQRYHRFLNLTIGLYHLDPFWHSHHADGRCDGVTASNWSHSEFHWPAGLGERGSNRGTKWQMLYMLLAGSKFKAARWGDENATGNEYNGTYKMEDQDLPTNIWGSGMQCCAQNAQVVPEESHRFWNDVLGYGYKTNNLRAMVIDTLTTWHTGFTSRINNTDAHELWLDGYLGPSHGIGNEPIVYENDLFAKIGSGQT